MHMRCYSTAVARSRGLAEILLCWQLLHHNAFASQQQTQSSWHAFLHVGVRASSRILKPFCVRNDLPRLIIHDVGLTKWVSSPSLPYLRHQRPQLQWATSEDIAACSNEYDLILTGLPPHKKT